MPQNTINLENPSQANWEPKILSETTRFLNDVIPQDARPSISSTAVSILSKGIAPNTENIETGLVVGYVQSGKTMSFEAVIALAHDNGFPIVIVVAGVTKPLLAQSISRLRKDFGIDDSARPRKWIQLENPSDDDNIIQTINNTLEDWADADTPADLKKTILITVLKHHARLQKLASLISALELSGVPVLIIDDEADQASLNNEVGQGEESSTYKRLMEVRNGIPSHTYLQYTATPQAPLLINIADSLSPNFVEVLSPGNAYVGGKDFFINSDNYTRVIPVDDVPTNDNPLFEPPQSLLEALKVFMVGISADLILNGGMGNRSMMVHPSHRTAQHQEFLEWVNNAFEAWKQILNEPNDTSEKQSLLEEFEIVYNELSSTVGDNMPSFPQIAQGLKSAFRNTRILEVNARQGRTPEVDWASSYGWVLVGGQAMDRGFTIEGLTVTYMPRGIGTGNADTIQQRARFFGYKRNYLGFCRVYLEQGTLSAFKGYVEHEEDIRQQLLELQKNDQPLDQWKRAFILDEALKPCRASVLKFDYMKGQFGDEWLNPRVIVASDEVLNTNRTLVSDFIDAHNFEPDSGNSARTEAQKHLVTTLPLKTALETLLVDLKLPSVTDSKKMTGLLLQLKKAVEDNPNLNCTVYKMSPSVQRERGVDDEGKVLNLYQGESPVIPIEQRGSIYPGDRKIHSSTDVTVQIHQLQLTHNKHALAGMDNVPVIAVWVPMSLARSWVVQ